MRFVNPIIRFADWAITLLVSYLLLRFGTDQISRLVASRYVNGNYSEVDGWLCLLGAVALVTAFFVVNPRTRFYTATLLAISLVAESLRTLGYGEPLEFSIPIMSLGAATLVVLSSQSGKKLKQPAFDEHTLEGLGLFGNKL